VTQWVFLQWLETQTRDLWTMIVYSALLLDRSSFFTGEMTTTRRDRRKLVHAALTITAKMLHDGNHVINGISLEYELRLVIALNWYCVVLPEDFRTAAIRWSAAAGEAAA
jgi:hypothetical protein